MLNTQAFYNFLLNNNKAQKEMFKAGIRRRKKSFSEPNYLRKSFFRKLDFIYQWTSVSAYLPCGYPCFEASIPYFDIWKAGLDKEAVESKNFRPEGDNDDVVRKS